MRSWDLYPPPPIKHTQYYKYIIGEKIIIRVLTVDLEGQVKLHNGLISHNHANYIIMQGWGAGKFFRRLRLLVFFFERLRLQGAKKKPGSGS